MCILKHFCFYLELKTGVYTISVCYIIFHLTHIVFLSLDLRWENNELKGVSCIIVHCMLMFTCVLLLIAAYKENVCLTFLSLFADFLQIVGFNTYRVFHIVLDGFKLYLTLFFLFEMVMDIYVIMVVLSFYTELTSKRSQPLSDASDIPVAQTLN